MEVQSLRSGLSRARAEGDGALRVECYGCLRLGVADAEGLMDVLANIWNPKVASIKYTNRTYFGLFGVPGEGSCK